MLSPQQLKYLLGKVVEGGVVYIDVSYTDETKEETTFVVYHIPNRIVYMDGPFNRKTNQFLKNARRVGYHLTPESIWNN